MKTCCIIGRRCFALLERKGDGREGYPSVLLVIEYDEAEDGGPAWQGGETFEALYTQDGDAEVELPASKEAFDRWAADGGVDWTDIDSWNPLEWGRLEYFGTEPDIFPAPALPGSNEWNKRNAVNVDFSGGQSRYGQEAVDFMLASVDGVELYAEEKPDETDETATYEGLKASILGQAKEKGVPANRLRFYYDD